MYVGFVANSKFVSPNSLPSINFMRQSLTEMFTISEPVSYNHAFLYIRQLAIHLRSAVTLKKKVPNQYIFQYLIIKLFVFTLLFFRKISNQFIIGSIYLH